MGLSLWMQSEGLGVRRIGEYEDLAACTRRVRELDEALDICLETGELSEELMFYQDADIFAIDARGRKFVVTGEDEVSHCLRWEER